MDKEISEVQFKNIKSQILNSNDESKKGNIDEPIVDLINKINAYNDLVTTSSCSGRVIVVSKDEDNQKEDCKWVYTTHNKVIEKEFLESIQSEKGNLTVKFEPFILHIQSRTLKLAKSILTCALQCGFRNSGIVIGKHGKLMIAVRNTSNLEVPVTYSGELLVNDKYLCFLSSLANQKIERNLENILKFETAITELLSETLDQVAQ